MYVAPRGDRHTQVLPVLGYSLLVLSFWEFFVLIPTYSTLCSVSNGTRYLLPTTYCIFCDFLGIKSNTYLRYITYRRYVMYPYLHLLHAEFRMQIHTEFRAILLQKIPRNSAEFRGIPYVFRKIPYSVKKSKTHFHGHPNLFTQGRGGREES